MIFECKHTAFGPSEYEITDEQLQKAKHLAEELKKITDGNTDCNTWYAVHYIPGDPGDDGSTDPLEASVIAISSESDPYEIALFHENETEDPYAVFEFTDLLNPFRIYLLDTNAGRNLLFVRGNFAKAESNPKLGTIDINADEADYELREYFSDMFSRGILNDFDDMPGTDCKYTDIEKQCHAEHDAAVLTLLFDESKV